MMYNNPAAELQMLDRRLVEIYGEAQCLKWRKEQPAFLDYQTFELLHGHTILTETDLDESSHDIIEELESVDPINFPVDEVAVDRPSYFNPFRFRVQRSYLMNKYYRIGRTGKVLVLFAGEDVRQKYNASL